MRITENEITSVVRRFFRLNEFLFLSTLSNGEKLYYTINNNHLNQKQPDSIVYKEDLLILCEDKIFFSALFSRQMGKLSDYNKLLGFLTSDEDLNKFKAKVKRRFPNIDFKLKGCLSSLAPKLMNKQVIDHNYFMNIQILFLDEKTYRAVVFCSAELANYFPHKQLDIKL